MLSDRYRQLLTAYVDGELTSRQRRHVARLLRRSPEARQLLQQLQEDSLSLRNLPRPQLSVDLTEPVLRTISERRLTAGQRRTIRVSTASSWAAPLVSWAIAATVLLMLGAASYLYFAASLTHSEKPELARNLPEEELPAPEPDPEQHTPPAVDRPETPPRPPGKPSPKPDIAPVVKPPVVAKRPDEKPIKPSPVIPPAPPKQETVLTGQVEMFRMRKVSDVLPVVLKVRELDRETVRKDFITELRRDTEFRLELPCPHGSRALQRVQNAAKSVNLGLVVEKGAGERNKLQAQAGYAVYIEDITPEELALFIQRVGAEDAKLASRKPAEVQFDRLVLTRMTPQNQKELSALLGVDLTPEPTPKDARRADPRKPLSDKTAQQVGQNLAGQGGVPRPEAGKPAPKPPERFALVLAYNPIRSSPGSEEIKHFLETRKPPRSGTIRVLLVLRS